MFLAIDIGNTDSVIGLFKKENLVSSWRIVSAHTRAVDEYWILTKLFCDNAGHDITAIKGVIIGSVVPNLTHSFQQMVKKYLGVKVIIVNHHLDLGFELKVDIPASVGADRICNVAYARENFPKPAIIIDLGTATTFDVIDENGDYIGGAIAPGIYTGSTELARKAAKLSRIELKMPQHFIGKNTEDQMQTGIFTGHIAMIEGLINRMEKEYHHKFTVIATGGLCHEIAKNCSLIQKADKDLTLKGLKILFNRNHSK
jgi:type III pantothenate kinase